MLTEAPGPCGVLVAVEPVVGVREGEGVADGLLVVVSSSRVGSTVDVATVGVAVSVTAIRDSGVVDVEIFPFSSLPQTPQMPSAIKGTSRSAQRQVKVMRRLVPMGESMDGCSPGTTVSPGIDDATGSGHSSASKMVA